jgi:hypothetical protein
MTVRFAASDVRNLGGGFLSRVSISITLILFAFLSLYETPYETRIGLNAPTGCAQDRLQCAVPGPRYQAPIRNLT